MLTEWTIALTIMRERRRRNFVLPNYTPAKWWECDVFEITAAGFFREYEIKLTLGDFKADAKKFDIFLTGYYPNMQEHRRMKHDLMGQPCGPRQFWYVVPEGMLTPEQVPEWSGLITMHDRGEDYRPYWRYSEILEKKAPILHQHPCDKIVVEHARGICYWRLHNEWSNGRYSELLEEGAGI